MFITISPFTTTMSVGLPWWLRRYSVCLQCGRPGFYLWIGKIPWRRERLPTPVFWPGEFHRLVWSMGLQRVGHDWATFTFSLTCTIFFLFISTQNFISSEVISQILLSKILSSLITFIVFAWTCTAAMIWRWFSKFNTYKYSPLSSS